MYVRGRAQNLAEEELNKREKWCYCYIQLGCLLNPTVGFQLLCLELVMAQVPAKGQSGVSRHTLQPFQEACYQQADSEPFLHPSTEDGLQVPSANPTTNDSKLLEMHS